MYSVRCAAMKSSVAVSRAMGGSGVTMATHHDYVHDNGIEITWKPGGGWQFTDRHGTILQR